MGRAWGPALGFWFLAPAFVETHRLLPEAPGQWVVLCAALTAIFSLLGAVLGLFGGLALSAIEVLISGTFIDRRWAYGLFGGVSIAIAYALQSVVIQWNTFGLSSFSPLMVAEATVFGALCAFATAILAALYRLVARQGRRPAPAFLGSTLTALAVSGAFSLVLHTPAAGSEVDLGPLRADSSLTDDASADLYRARWRLLAQSSNPR